MCGYGIGFFIFFILFTPVNWNIIIYSRIYFIRPCLSATREKKAPMQCIISGWFDPWQIESVRLTFIVENPLSPVRRSCATAVKLTKMWSCKKKTQKIFFFQIKSKSHLLRGLLFLIEVRKSEKAIFLDFNSSKKWTKLLTFIVENPLSPVRRSCATAVKLTKLWSCKKKNERILFLVFKSSKKWAKFFA